MQAVANDQIEKRTAEKVDRLTQQGPEAVDRRLREVEREWGLNRALEANAGLAMLGGVALGAVLGRKWLSLPAAIGVMLVVHARTGYCPAVPLFRRLGFRTPDEIDNERFALKAMRGDFRVL